MLTFKSYFYQTLAVVIVLFSQLSLPAFAADQTTQQEIVIQNLAVMPFILGGRGAKLEKNLEKSLDCSLRGLCNIEGDPSGIAEETVTKLFQQELKKRLGYKVIPQSQVQPVFRKLSSNNEKTPRDIAVELGRNLTVDHVLVGIINRYEEKVGSSLAAETPASVSFSVFLVNVSNSKLVWKSSFDKTQTSLSENLFDAPMFFKQGMKWFTAGELAGFGVNESLDKLLIN